jgi:hypothetical protein
LGVFTHHCDGSETPSESRSHRMLEVWKRNAGEIKQSTYFFNVADLQTFPFDLTSRLSSRAIKGQKSNE